MMTSSKPTAIDISAALAPLSPFTGRTPEPAEADLEPVFAELAVYEDGGVYAGTFTGESAWERHMNGDELVQILKGATQVTILTDDHETVLDMTAGMLTIVPRGCWHKFTSASGVTVMTKTPSPTDHSTAVDPRKT